MESKSIKCVERDDDNDNDNDNDSDDNGWC